jgi:hypothetical protein
VTPQFDVTFNRRTCLVDAIYHLLFSRTDISLTGVDETLLLARCRVESKAEPKATRGRSAVVETRLDDLLVEGHEYGKVFDWFEFLGFSEDMQEHLGSLFNAMDVVHVFRFFSFTRDIHEVIVGEQDRSIIHANTIGSGVRNQPFLRLQNAP